MLSSINLNLLDLLRDPARRRAFFRSVTQDDIAMQIREWRKKRGMTQQSFAIAAEMKQSAISRIEQADYAAWNFGTLIRIADALDGRWKVTFVPAEDAVKEFAEPDTDAPTEMANSGTYDLLPITASLSAPNDAYFSTLVS